MAQVIVLSEVYVDVLEFHKMEAWQASAAGVGVWRDVHDPNRYCLQSMFQSEADADEALRSITEGKSLVEALGSAASVPDVRRCEVLWRSGRPAQGAGAMTMVHVWASPGHGSDKRSDLQDVLDSLGYAAGFEGSLLAANEADSDELFALAYWMDLGAAHGSIPEYAEHDVRIFEPALASRTR